jgi:hypothetical protein
LVFYCINPESKGASSSSFIESKAASAILGRGSLADVLAVDLAYAASIYFLPLYSLLSSYSLFNY